MSRVNRLHPLSVVVMGHFVVVCVFFLGGLGVDSKDVNTDTHTPLQHCCGVCSDFIILFLSLSDSTSISPPAKHTHTRVSTSCQVSFSVTLCLGQCWKSEFTQLVREIRMRTELYSNEWTVPKYVHHLLPTPNLSYNSNEYG